MFSANARALRHFFNVRGAIDGDLEMRRVCAALFEEVTKDSSALFQDFVLEDYSDGTPRVRRVRRDEPRKTLQPRMDVRSLRSGTGM